MDVIFIKYLIFSNYLLYSVEYLLGFYGVKEFVIM